MTQRKLTEQLEKELIVPLYDVVGIRGAFTAKCLICKFRDMADCKLNKKKICVEGIREWLIEQGKGGIK